MHTDVLSILSGGSLYVMDPTGRFFVDPSNDDVVSDPRAIGSCYPISLQDNFPDQFLPFSIFGLNSNVPFQGTVIRLPLRSKSRSGISLHTNVYKSSSHFFSGLHKSLVEFANHAPIFLPHTEEIVVMSVSTANPKSVRLFQV